jgi:predicted Fe-Mo cluster-binding NifX family protein
VRICVPTEDDTGLEATVSEHFGGARWFTIVDSESGDSRSVINGEHGHRPGTCDAAESIAGLGVQAVVCVGMGRRALASMQRAGIPVYRTESRTVGLVVAEFKLDILLPLFQEEACSGGHGFGAHHRHGS